MQRLDKARLNVIIPVFITFTFVFGCKGTANKIMAQYLKPSVLALRQYKGKSGNNQY
jgi:hypothetical protein